MRTNLLLRRISWRAGHLQGSYHTYTTLYKGYLKLLVNLNLDFNPIGWKGSERFPILLILLLFVHQIMTIAVKGTTQQTDKRHTQKPRT